MGQEHTSDAEVASQPATLSLASLCQWDLLAFLYRHQTTLVGADDLARLLGYTTESVVAAMDALASLGLIGRSRVSHGARFYQFIMPSDSPHGEAFARGSDNQFMTREFTIGQGGITLLPVDESVALPVLPFQSYYGLLSRAPTRLSPRLPRSAEASSASMEEPPHSQ